MNKPISKYWPKEYHGITSCLLTVNCQSLRVYPVEVAETSVQMFNADWITNKLLEVWPCVIG